MTEWWLGRCTARLVHVVGQQRGEPTSASTRRDRPHTRRAHVRGRRVRPHVARGSRLGGSTARPPARRSGRARRPRDRCRRTRSRACRPASAPKTRRWRWTSTSRGPPLVRSVPDSAGGTPEDERRNKADRGVVDADGDVVGKLRARAQFCIRRRSGFGTTRRPQAERSGDRLNFDVSLRTIGEKIATHGSRGRQRHRAPSRRRELRSGPSGRSSA